MKEEDMTDRELLIVMDYKLDELGKNFTNHLHTHSRYAYLLIATTLSALGALIVALSV